MTKPQETAADFRRESSIANQDSASSSQIWQQAWTGLVAAVFVSRFFVPAESAAQGDTLWIAGLWMTCGVAWTIGIWRGLFPRIRCNWLDGAVALWIGSQLISTLVIILTTGDKRSAANMAWEWMALGIVWLIVRHGFAQATDRNALVRAMIVTGVVLGGYGLNQHYISHPRLVAEYGPLFDRLRTASGADAVRIRQKLAREGIPTEGPALVLFEKRLRDSREPLGMFALANTFGGFLAVCLLLTLGEILSQRQAGIGWRLQVPWILAAAIIGWCLLLTKSRTAWIGSLCGLVVLAAPQVRIWANYRRWLLPGGLAIAVLGVVASVIFFLGGLDRQVLSEAPKSLAYRIQYWQATSHLIFDHWILGVGPGNFRQHYLKYKLPVASEEIADPHNLFFEVAATGGIFSAIGLALFLGLAFMSARRVLETASTPRLPETSNNRTFWMAGIGIVLAFAGPLIVWEEWEDRVLVLGVLWMIVAWVFAVGGRRITGTAEKRADNLSLATLAAAVALAVHLLGAGGIAMPAVSQVLVALLAISLGPSSAPTAGAKGRSGFLLASFAFSAMLAGLITTTLMPVWKCRWLLRHGNATGMVSGPDRIEAAMTFYRRAADADPWSPDPWRQQFEWTTVGGIRSNDSFETAVKQMREVMRRDPANFWAFRTVGELWRQKWKMTGELEDARQAVNWLRQAQELYPTNSGIRAELAFALNSARETDAAADAAADALSQDEVYHRCGHVDRYLDDPTRERLKSLRVDSPR